MADVISRPGENEVLFEIRGQRSLFEAAASIFLWECNDPVIVCDVDGTLFQRDMRSRFDLFMPCSLFRKPRNSLLSPALELTASPLPRTYSTQNRTSLQPRRGCSHGWTYPVDVWHTIHACARKHSFCSGRCRPCCCTQLRRTCPAHGCRGIRYPFGVHSSGFTAA